MPHDPPLSLTPATAPTTPPHTGMPHPVPGPSTLGDRLMLARQARFVGREAECLHFERMLAGLAEPVWWLHGPGGMGKTTLLAELARRAEAAGRIVLELDARHMNASPEGWHQALRLALQPQAVDMQEPPEQPVPPEASILLVDTLEAVSDLQAWLCTEELPRYPADVLVVLAGRSPADPQWRLDPGWSALAAVTRLAPWSEQEAQAFVCSRLGGQAVPEGLLKRGAGVPLLLALLVEAHRRGQDLADEPVPEAQLHESLVRVLLDRFARELSSPELRMAFHVLMVARCVSPLMLADTVHAASAHELFDWLASLPFVQQGEQGLQMHDLVRQAFVASWMARDPDAVSQAGLQVQQHLARRVPSLGRDEALQHLKDWIFVLRATPVAPYIDHRHVEDHDLRPLEHHGPQVLQLVQQRLGSGMAEVVAHWLAHRPGDFRLVRHRQGQLAGVLLLLELTQIAPELMAPDPATARVWAHVQGVRPLAPDASVCLARLVLDASTDRLPNPTVTLAGMWLTQRSLGNARAEWNISLHHNADDIAPLMAAMTRLNWAHREPLLDQVLQGRHHGAFVRDYVREPVGPQWRPAPTPGPAAPALLNRDDFAQAIREALRHLSRDDVLAQSPLSHCQVFADDGAGQPALPASPARLRQVIAQAVQALAQHPADLKFHRALWHTWILPGAKQEAVAAELGLPFNTYRYHLARGAERVALQLWQQESLARTA